MVTMGIWKFTGKIVWVSTKLTAKAVTAIAGLICRCASATTKAIFHRRDAIGAWAAKIAGTVIGSVNGVIGAAQDVLGHLISQKSINEKLYTIEMQSHRYHDLTERNNARLCIAGRQRKASGDRQTMC